LEKFYQQNIIAAVVILSGITIAAKYAGTGWYKSFSLFCLKTFAGKDLFSMPGFERAIELALLIR